MRAAVRDEGAVRLTKGDRTRQRMLEAALEVLDESGVNSITLQALGERLDMHPTSMYRYFANVDDLLAGLLASLLDDLGASLELPEDPRERLVTIARAIRQLFHRHPGAAALLVSEAGEQLVAPELVTPVLASLRGLGVTEADLAVAYQAYETHVLGTTLFDFSGAPNHLESRRRRHLAVDDETMRADSRTARKVDGVNEQAFELTLSALLDRLGNQTS